MTREGVRKRSIKKLCIEELPLRGTTEVNQRPLDNRESKRACVASAGSRSSPLRRRVRVRGTCRAGCFNGFSCSGPAIGRNAVGAIKMGSFRFPHASTCQLRATQARERERERERESLLETRSASLHIGTTFNVPPFGLLTPHRSVAVSRGMQRLLGSA